MGETRPQPAGETLKPDLANFVTSRTIEIQRRFHNM